MRQIMKTTKFFTFYELFNTFVQKYGAHLKKK